jgi:hypothetical protein
VRVGEFRNRMASIMHVNFVFNLNFILQNSIPLLFFGYQNRWFVNARDCRNSNMVANMKLLHTLMILIPYTDVYLMERCWFGTKRQKDSQSLAQIVKLVSIPCLCYSLSHENFDL